MSEKVEAKEGTRAALCMSAAWSRDPAIPGNYRAMFKTIADLICPDEPIDMLLTCPQCHRQHIDEPDPLGGASVGPDGRESRWENPPHRSHLCRYCWTVWRPAEVATNGVARLASGHQLPKLDNLPPAPPCPPPPRAVTPVWQVHAVAQNAAGETHHFDGLFVGEVATLEGYRDLRASVAKSLGQNDANAVVICNLSRVGEQG